MNRALGVVATVVVVGSGFAVATRSHVAPLPYYTDATLTPHWIVDPDSVAAVPRVGDFRLVDQTGRSVTRSDIEGKVYVAAFFYTTCRNLCPTVKGQLARVRDAFAGDTSVRILSHSVTPEADGVAALAHYASLNGIDGKQWRLLTGSRPEVERLARERYFVELSDTTGNTQGTLQHTETLVLVDRDGRIRGAYSGSVAFEVTQLIADVRQLLEERTE
jgi:protein SCO1/2